MEKWQKDHINKNLVDLINNTNCDVILISKLVSLQILGKSDQEQLELKTLTPSEKAKTLYDILQTRKGAFKALMRCLEETKQTGGLAILKAHNPILQNHGLITKDETRILSIDNSGVTIIYGGKFDGRAVAVKRVNHLLLTTLETPLKEVECLKMLDKHKNIVGHYFTEIDNNFVYIAMEQCKINLEDEIQMKLLNFPVATILKKCTVGLAYLHDHNIIHRNLNPKNILLFDVPEYVKISDFQLAQQLPAGKSLVNILEKDKRSEWNAPEILRAPVEKVAYIGKASDIFSLGCIFHYVLTDGMHAFGEEEERIYNIRHNKPQLKVDTLGEVWTEPVEKMVSYSPKDRPMAHTAICMCFGFKRLDEQTADIKTNFVEVDLSTKLANHLKGLSLLLRATNMNPSFGRITINRNRDKVLERKHTFVIFKGRFGRKKVAVKVMSSSIINPEKCIEEVNTLKKLKPHANVAQYFQVETNKDFVLIACEIWISNLRQEFKLRKPNLNSDDARMQCTAGLVHLHNNQIVHGNLNPSTIVINEKRQIKISGFGLSMQASKNMSCINEDGEWASPEVLNENSENLVPKITTSSDVFSLGCIYYYIQTKGSHPFGEPGDRIYNIIHNKLRISELIPTGDKLMETINKMISPSLDERPLASDILTSGNYKKDPAPRHSLT